MIKINNEVITPTNFPDGTKLLKLNPFNSGSYGTLIEWFYESDEEMFTLYCLVKHCQKHGYNCRLFLPYIPNARMDRVKSEDEVFTLKYFAEFINSLDFKSVMVVDPHSYVSTALIDRVQVIEPADYIIKAIQKSNPDVVFFPDEGAMKRYSGLVDTGACGQAFGMKRRDWSTGRILGLDIHGDIDMVKGAKVLIIDDICSKGGTFFYSAKALKEAGAANIDLYITHCENTIFEGELLKPDSLIDKIYTTNSIYKGEHEKIEVFEV
jgi:ribose-phosphate pyrophosphokinase